MHQTITAGVIPSDFKYASVLEKGRPVHGDDYFSIRHPRMGTGQRAKIFAPFAALSGFEDEIGAKKVQYVKERIPDADELYELNDQLNRLYELTTGKKKTEVNAVIEYYVPCQDPHNKAYQIKGTYETVTDIVRKVDPITQQLRIGDLTLDFRDLSRITFTDPK